MNERAGIVRPIRRGRPSPCESPAACRRGRDFTNLTDSQGACRLSLPAGSFVALAVAFACPVVNPPQPQLRDSSRLARHGLRAAVVVSALAMGYALRWSLDAAPPGGATAVTERVPGTRRVAGTRRGFGPALAVEPYGRMPGEFERKDALLLGVNELIRFHPQTLVDIVAAIAGQTRIVALISEAAQEQQVLDLLRGRGLATDTISFFVWPAESMWVQDFGPQEVVGEHGARVVDFEYQVPGLEVENQLPMAFAASFGMQITHSHLAMEGGGYLSNGRGLCISSTRLIEQNQSRGFDIQSIGRFLHTAFNFKDWIYVPPIIGETTGHLDLFLSLGGPGTIFLAAYDPAEDRENADRMDANARTLMENVVVEGRPPEIIRIRQPAARDGCWRSYTNVIYANGVVLVPQFPDFSPDLDREALATYRRAFPDRQVVGIDTSAIIRKRGGLHCLSLDLPHLPGKLSAGVQRLPANGAQGL